MTALLLQRLAVCSSHLVPHVQGIELQGLNLPNLKTLHTCP